MTKQTRKVLHARTRPSDRERYGLDPAQEAPVAHGTMYGILLRLEDRAGSKAASTYPVDRTAPPRHYYSLASDGAARTDVALTRAA
jgi:DNA-binding PadR family transcriptional regulator